MSDPHPPIDQACGELGIPVDARTAIMQRHGEPHRRYHTLRHIDLMLRQLPEGHPFAREMKAATLFHDIVYDPSRPDNEEQSLSAFLAVADRFEPDAPLDTALVSAMILATKSHHFRDGNAPADEAVNLLLKADLSILWHSDPQVYRWYAEGVRHEYGFVPEDQFREARTRILSTLRDDLIRSGQLTAEEAAALTRNTGRELEELAAPRDPIA